MSTILCCIVNPRCAVLCTRVLDAAFAGIATAVQSSAAHAITLAPARRALRLVPQVCPLQSAPAAGRRESSGSGDGQAHESSQGEVIDVGRSPARQAVAQGGPQPRGTGLSRRSRSASVRCFSVRVSASAFPASKPGASGRRYWPARSRASLFTFRRAIPAQVGPALTVHGWPSCSAVSRSARPATRASRRLVQPRERRVGSSASPARRAIIGLAVGTPITQRRWKPHD